MDTEELDAWYEEQKDKYTEDYKKNLKKTDKDFSEKLRKASDEEKKIIDQRIRASHSKIKKKYLAKMESLHKIYEKKTKKALKSNLKFHFLRHKVTMWKKKYLKFWYDFKDEMKHRKEQKK